MNVMQQSTPTSKPGPARSTQLTEHKQKIDEVFVRNMSDDVW
jgi:hypothetical protein